MAKGWKQAFDDPIPLPNGRQLVTLQDAANYIMKLKRAEQKLEEWQTATEVLIMAAEGRGPLMHARIGVLRAIHRNEPRVFNPDRKRNALGKAEAEAGRTAMMGRRMSNKMKDHYAVLGIARDADPDVVRAAYRALAKRFHPDAVAGNAETASRFREIAMPIRCSLGQNNERSMISPFLQ
jgi:DnaJ-like protein